MEGPFLKGFHGRWGKIYWGKGGRRAALYGRLISDHAKGGEVSQIHFLAFIFIFPIVKVYTLEDKALIKIMEVFILEVNG